MQARVHFPPAFFDVMVHLAVHLPEEARLRGHVHYGWMYPVERRLYTLKRYLRNRARPEGSIAEGYVADECLTFCSRYMDDVNTVYNKEPRNSAFEDLDAYDVQVFGHGVKFISACNYGEEDPEEVKKMVWYVLHNSDETAEYRRYVFTS